PILLRMANDRGQRIFEQIHVLDEGAGVGIGELRGPVPADRDQALAFHVEPGAESPVFVVIHLAGLFASRNVKESYRFVRRTARETRAIRREGSAKQRIIRNQRRVLQFTSRKIPDLDFAESRGTAAYCSQGRAIRRKEDGVNAIGKSGQSGDEVSAIRA